MYYLLCIMLHRFLTFKSCVYSFMCIIFFEVDLKCLSKASGCSGVIKYNLTLISKSPLSIVSSLLLWRSGSKFKNSSHIEYLYQHCRRVKGETVPSFLCFRVSPDCFICLNPFLRKFHFDVKHEAELFNLPVLLNKNKSVQTKRLIIE